MKLENKKDHMTRTERYALEINQRRQKKQRAKQILFASVKVLFVVIVCLTCTVYLVGMPESSAYFTSYSKSEPRSIVLDKREMSLGSFEPEEGMVLTAADGVGMGETSLTGDYADQDQKNDKDEEKEDNDESTGK